MSDDPIVRASVWGTVVFAVLAVVAAATGAGGLVVVSVIADLALFTVGCVAFVLTLARAAARSRTEELTLSGIWWLAGTVPTAVRRPLLAALGAEIVIALATAGARPFTGLAFGVLVPVYGLGLAGLSAVRIGTFPPRV